jgi:hypothetical protein
MEGYGFWLGGYARFTDMMNAQVPTYHLGTADSMLYLKVTFCPKIQLFFLLHKKRA